MKSLICFLLLSFPMMLKTFSQDPYTPPEWTKDATIYEVNIRQYTPEGTLKAFEAHLPRLKEMGVKILWIMPIYPIGETGRKGSLGSYYAVKDYRAVNPEFGTMNDFKDLVKKAHKLGFKVILDWVADHSSPDNLLTSEHPEWYLHDSTGKIIPPVADWTDVAGFNYKNKDLWKYQIESMKFWIKETKIDGFRCDVAMMVPLDFWKEARMELDKVKRVFMLAEAEGPEFHRNGFDMTYGWEFHKLMNQIARDKRHANALIEYLHNSDDRYKQGEYRMYFTSNHDENTWNGSEYERMGDAVKTLDVLTFTLPGMPLIYTGQESAEMRRLVFFDKDSVEWKNYPLADFYKKLVLLKKQNPALWNGAYGGSLTIITTANNNVFCFTRIKDNDKIMVLLNLSKDEQTLDINDPGIVGTYQSLFDDQPVSITSDYNVTLGPWDFKVLVQNKNER